MFTVILLDKNSSDLLVDYRFLFQSFENAGDIAICAWNENGSNFETMLPDIKRIIQGKREWRAIVVNTDSLYGYRSKSIPDVENPFDYSRVDRDRLPHKSTIPLIRLCHVLGGYPAPVREFEDGFEFYDQSNDLRQVRRSELSEEDIAYISEQFAPVKNIFMEKPIPEGVRKRHLALERKYSFDGVRPSEILLIATRNQRETTAHVRAAEAWKNPTEMASSAFCERNKYPTNCRFMFSDISSTHTANYERDLTKFWLSVLTVAKNKIPPVVLQAYRLYCLKIDISSESLENMLNEHLDRLEAVQRYIRDELAKEVDPNIRGNIHHYEEVDIPVLPDKDDEENILSQDESDEKKPEWISLMNERLSHFNSSAKDTRRAIDRAARVLRAKWDYYAKREDPVCMDAYHLGDLKADLAARELAIVSSRPKNKYDREKVNTILSEARVQQTQHLADEEMPYTKQATVVAVLLALLGFFPWLQGAWNLGGSYFIKVLLVTILVLGIMIGGGLFAMNRFRSSMKKKVFEITDRFKEVQKDMTDTVNSYSQYFSDIGTFMSAQSTLKRVSLSDAGKIFRDNLSIHSKAVASLIETDNRWMRNFELNRVETPVQHIESFFNCNIAPYDNSLYYYDTCDEVVEIPLNTAGDQIVTPYAFISDLKIQREAVFDDVEAKR